MHARVKTAVRKAQRALRKASGRTPLFVPPGHFYSPVTHRAAIRRDDHRLFGTSGELAAIDLNTDAQLDLLRRLGRHYGEMPFAATATPGLLYHLDNEYYTYADGIVYYAMLREMRPQRVVEVGSGFSSALALDVNRLFFDGAIDLTFVEPFPDVLRRLLKGSATSVRLIEDRVQDVEPAVFDTLAAGDILFIDSTHVVKTGSDVNCLFFEVLPRLAPGVLVHFHDVFYPFEYPRQWVLEGRSWNEQYLLRSFLQYNDAFEIVFFTTYLATEFAEEFDRLLPLARRNTGGSIWLRRRAT